MGDEEDSEPRKRGRPAAADQAKILAILNEFKLRLCPKDDGQKIVSKKDEVWMEISSRLDNKKSPSALYAYMTCNKNDVRQKIWKDYILTDNVMEGLDESLPETLIANSTLDSTIEDENTFSFTIHVPGTDFDKLVETRSVFNKKRKKPVEVKKFRPDLWQEFVTQKIWTNTRLSCGFNFKYHYLNKDVSSGHFAGACNCGSKIQCAIDRTGDNIVAMVCTITKGSKECGKRYVRGGLRDALGEKLQSKSAHAFRANMADDLMEEGDPEPPHLPKTGTLRQIKHQVDAKKFLDPNPIVGLEILNTFAMKGEITSIGHKPFFVHYSTKLQRNVYETVRKREHLCIAIDSTGSIIQPVSRVNKKKSGPIFLYLAVVSTSSGQLPVAQMLTERHTTGAIHFWLSEWVEQWGLPLPTEIVCDQAVALLSGAVRAFTAHKTLNQYADAFFDSKVPPCYIRIDIAHYLKTWTVFLKDVRLEVAKFLKAGIGKVILSRNIEDARKIITALLTITIGKDCGATVHGTLSACGKAKAFLKHFLETAEMMQFMDQFGDDDSSDDATDSTSEEITTRQTGGAEPSLWRNWATEIAESVRDDLDSAPGTEINPHWTPKFADRLVAEIKWLPLWSCVFRDKYGFGRCPASSAHVEAEFGKIKRQLLADVNPPLRADEFVRIHKKYLDGNSKTITASVNHNINSNCEQNTTECSEAGDLNPCPEVSIDSTTTIDDRRSTIEDTIHITKDADGQSPVELIHVSCPACENGDIPGGAHNCMICARAVHAIEPCSVAASESDEGFGQKRVCASCIAKPNSGQLIESRAQENWRNQVVTHEKKQSREKTAREKETIVEQKQAQNKNPQGKKQACGKYLQETYPVNEFLLTDSLATIPILKSGSETKLKAIRQGETRVDLIRTCSFDSIFQLLLTVAFDSENFLQNVIRANKANNPFCQLIDTTRIKAITTVTYRARVEILSEHFKKTGHADVNCFVITCECTVAAMARKILVNVPCFTEKSFCNVQSTQCLPTTKKFPILAVSLHALLADDYNEAVYESIVMQPRSCSSEGCTGKVISELKSSGKVTHCKKRM